MGSTVIHGDAAVFYAADEDAQLVLALRVLHQLGLDAEAPHLFQVVPRQLYLVQRFCADLNHLVTGYLHRNKSFSSNNRR